jgi:hypothetical protein
VEPLALTGGSRAPEAPLEEFASPAVGSPPVATPPEARLTVWFDGRSWSVQTQNGTFDDYRNFDWKSFRGLAELRNPRAERRAEPAPPQTALFTVQSSIDFARRYERSLLNHMSYARFHGYDIFIYFPRDGAARTETMFDKFRGTRELLALYDSVFMMDGDTYFTTHACVHRIEDHLNRIYLHAGWGLGDAAITTVRALRALNA